MLFTSLTVHTPIRYAWEMTNSHLESAGGLTRALARPIMHYRQWDVLGGKSLITLSPTRPRSRPNEKHYRRPATVIHPPVDTKYYTPSGEVSDFFLVAGRLVPYKRAYLAVEAFNRLDYPLS